MAVHTNFPPQGQKSQCKFMRKFHTRTRICGCIHKDMCMYVCMYKLIEIEFVCFCSHVYLKHAPNGAIKTHRNTYPLLCLCDGMSRSCALRSIYLFYQFYIYTHTHIKIHISVRTRGGANRNQHTHTAQRCMQCASTPFLIVGCLPVRSGLR